MEEMKEGVSRVSAQDSKHKQASRPLEEKNGYRCIFSIRDFYVSNYLNFSNGFVNDIFISMIRFFFNRFFGDLYFSFFQ